MALERFEREARAAAAINHPNICTLHEIGEHDGHPFLAMELLEGETLKDRIGTKALPIDALLVWAIQITDGLEAAHARGVVIRDIKPGNIFIQRGTLLRFWILVSPSKPALNPSRRRGRRSPSGRSTESLARRRGHRGTCHPNRCGVRIWMRYRPV